LRQKAQEKKEFKKKKNFETYWAKKLNTITTSVYIRYAVLKVEKW